MDAWFDALQERLRGRYLGAYAVFNVASSLVFAVGGVLLLSLYAEMSARDAVLMTGGGFAFAAGPVAWGAWIAIRRAGALRAWLDGPRTQDGARAAWLVATTFVPGYIAAVTWRVALVGFPGFAIYAALVLGLPAYSVPVIVGSGLVMLAYAAALHFLLLEAALAPILARLAGQASGEADVTQPSLSLRRKLLVFLPVINVITGFVVAFLAEDGRPAFGEVIADVGLAVAIALSTSLVLTALLTRSVLAPIGRLVEATRRVRAGDLAARVPVTAQDELGVLGTSFNGMMRGLAERETLASALGTYVAPGVAKRLIDEGERLSSRAADVTVMFVDIRDFTRFSEEAAPETVVDTLNEFFELVVSSLAAHGGYANRFMGDGVLAVFGAPDPMPDHADRAVDAAVDISVQVEGRYGDELRIGIGLNSGRVVTGTVGGGGRLEFMLIGDAVNVASRVEGLTRETGDRVLLTEATRTLLSRPRPLESRGDVPVKGKRAPVRIYAATERRPSDALRDQTATGTIRRGGPGDS